LSNLTALVLAGTRPGGDPLARHAGVSHKALIAVGGVSMIERVTQAVAAEPRVGRIVIAIEDSGILETLSSLRALARQQTVVTMPTATGPSATVAAALARYGTPLLVTTADHALLQTRWVREFLDACPAPADVIVALARREQIEAQVPATRRTYLRFSDGDFSGCNLFLLQHAAASKVVTLWQQLENDRKQPLRMLGRLGYRYAIRYLLRRLSLEQAMERLGALSQARVSTVLLTDGRAAIDVDSPADLDLARNLVTGV
jgi:GTP:adenosylcobinamide-phosphate guanylyltransferase